MIHSVTNNNIDGSRLLNDNSLNFVTSYSNLQFNKIKSNMLYLRYYEVLDFVTSEVKFIL